ncbi:hypothetical protein [Pararhizobium sp. O133]|uniref:hypothetical protein n=1 Tax=Pararhizobium sp. O133 TaxID=3449278 RepID=UPI003F687BA6
MDWDAAEALTEAACASMFDTTDCVLQPRKTGASVNHAEIDDPDRLPFDFKGTIELEPPSDRIARHQPSDPAIRNGTVSYDAVLTAYTAAWPYKPARGDYVTAKLLTWKIAANEPDGSARGVYYLNRAKA